MDINILAIGAVILAGAYRAWRAAAGKQKDVRRPLSRAGLGPQGERQYFRANGAHPYAHLRIKYIDANGEETDRDIAVWHIDLRDGRIRAYCRLREGERTFFISRVKGAVDIETGEVVQDLRQFLRAARSTAR